MNQVRRAFDRAARRYDAHAQQQRYVSQKLAEMAAPYRTDWVLDVGAGTGYLKELTAWPMVASDFAPAMCGVAAKKGQPVFAADFHALPVVDNSAPMLFSSLALQWSDDPLGALREWHRAVKRDGVVVISTYLYNTLSELKKSFKVIDEAVPIRSFLSEAECLNLIKEAGFTIKQSDTFVLTREDKSLFSLLSYMKEIGASTSSSSSKTLKTKRYFERLDAAYPKTDGKLISSWEVGCFVLEKHA